MGGKMGIGEGGSGVKLSNGMMKFGGWLHAPDYASSHGIPLDEIYAWVKSGYIPYGIFRGMVMIHVGCGRRKKWNPGDGRGKRGKVELNEGEDMG